MENSEAVPQKLKIEFPYENPAIDHGSGDIKSRRILKRHLHNPVHNSIIHNSQRGKSNPNVHPQMNKQNVIHTYNGILLFSLNNMLLLLLLVLQSLIT